MILPKTTAKQKRILFLLYKFRFLNTNQFQKLFKHKDPHRIKEWLKDLKDKKYIKTNYKRFKFIDNTKPAVYYLAPLGRSFLKGKEGFDLTILERVYKEPKIQENFRNHCMAVADMYIFLLSQNQKGKELKFFTVTDLADYEYFPETELDAYIAIKSEKTTRRFFMNLFDENTPAWVYRKRIREYRGYYDGEKWQEHTKNPFPSILFVCPSEKAKTHIFIYSKAILEKAITVNISLFLTTKNTIQSAGDKTNIWQKVE